MSIRIVIFTQENGAGLSVDAEILKQFLGSMGCEFQMAGEQSDPPTHSPDCTLFLERIDFRFAGRFNVLVPNPEWFDHHFLGELYRFDRVACKTREGLRVMSRLAGVKAMHIGWTTPDRFQAAGEKRFDEWLHVVGRSSQKGTEPLIQAWRMNPDFPLLHVVDWREQSPSIADPPNVRRHWQRMEEDAFNELMNRCAVHVCPSMTEGFGHTLHEALCCGAMLIATDGPPMNEIPAEAAVRIPTIKQIPAQLATMYCVSPSGIVQAVRSVLAMSESQRQAMQQAGRSHWEQSRVEFGKAIGELDKIIRQRLSA